MRKPYNSKRGVSYVQARNDWMHAMFERAKQEAVLPVFNRQATDERTIAERAWSAPLKPPAPQQPCDIGMFSDDANQLDLIEMFQDPTND